MDVSIDELSDYLHVNSTRFAKQRRFGLAQYRKPSDNFVTSILYVFTVRVFNSFISTDSLAPSFLNCYSTLYNFSVKLIQVESSVKISR